MPLYREPQGEPQSPLVGSNSATKETTGFAFVGTSAIQVAKQIGAKIFVTASSQEKLDFCKQLGADVLINYKEQNFVDIIQKETSGPELKVSMITRTSMTVLLGCCNKLLIYPGGVLRNTVRLNVI